MRLPDAHAPDWVLSAIRAPKVSNTSQPTTITGTTTARESKYAQAALNSEADKVAATRKGVRNEQLNKAAFSIGTMVARGWIGRATVEGRLHDACTSNGLVNDDGAQSVASTIKSGIEAGINSPHADLEDRQQRSGRGENSEHAKRIADKYIARDGGSPGSDAAELERLAKLSAIEYERERKDAAEKLGIDRVTALDSVVKAQRGKESDDQKTFLPHWTVQPWPDPVDGDSLLTELQAYFKRYVVLPQHADAALALWVLHTWVFECFDITPYLCISSPTQRCGKTLLMTMLLWLCCRAKKNDSMSKAAIYRSVERDKPTLVLDEVGWVVDQRDERQNILCGGFERNGHAETCEGEGASITTRLWSTYCPKAFGLVGKLTATLMDRSIEIRMQRKLSEKVERLRRRDNDEHARFRRQCLRWAQDHAKALAVATPALPDKLNDRALDFWEPLLAIAAHVGGEWTKVASEAAFVLSNEENTEQEERGVELLADIKKISDSDVTEIATKELIAALCADEERPWATWNKGKPISDRQVAKLLKPFVVISETIYAPVGSGKKDAKGYKLDKLKDVFGRYLTPGKDGRKAPSSGSEGPQASERQNADGSSTSRVFSIRQESESDGCENNKFSHSPSDSDAQTAKKVKSPEEALPGHSNDGNGQAEIVANGYAISTSPEDRRPAEDPTDLEIPPFLRRQNPRAEDPREIRHPAISSGPDDDLDDFAP